MFLIIICRNNGFDNRKYWNLRKEVIPMAGRKPKPTAMKKEWERLAKLMNQMDVPTDDAGGL